MRDYEPLSDVQTQINTDMATTAPTGRGVEAFLALGRRRKACYDGKKIGAHGEDGEWDAEAIKYDK